MEREVTLGGNVCDEWPSLMRTCANVAELRAHDVAVVGSVISAECAPAANHADGAGEIRYSKSTAR